MSKKRNIQQRGNSFLVDVTKFGKRQRVTCDTLEEAQSIRAKIESVECSEFIGAMDISHLTRHTS